MFENTLETHLKIELKVALKQLPNHEANVLLLRNGFNGEEACTLMQYAGLSKNCSSIGIYGYIPEQDTHQMTAKQIIRRVTFNFGDWPIRIYLSLKLTSPRPLTAARR